MKDFPKTISMLSAFLLALGFVNNYGFYSHFDIEIFTYLNSSEIILSFLPMVIPLLISFLIIIYLSLIEDYKLDNEKKYNSFIANKDLTFWGPFRDLIKLARNKFKTNDKSGNIIYYFIVQIFFRLLYVIVFWVLTYSYFKAFIEKEELPYNSPIIFFTISIIWLTITTYKASKYFIRKYKKISNAMSITLFLLGFLGIIYLYNSFKAFKILGDNPIYSVELTTKDHCLKTDKGFVYIGKTKEYYFFRNLKIHENIIYNDRNIEKIKIMKIIEN